MAKKLVASGSFTVTKMDDIYEIKLAPSTVAIPANADGSNPVLSSAKTRLIVNKDAVVVSTVITSLSPKNCTATFVGNEVSLTSLLADSGEVEIHFSVDKQFRSAIFSWTKAKQGSAGTDAYTVVLTNESHTIAAAADGSVTQDQLDRAQSRITVWKGSTPLSPVAANATPGLGQYRYNISLTTGGYSGRAGNDSFKFTGFGNNQVISAEIQLTIWIEGIQQIFKIMSITKSMAGSSGAPGIQGPSQNPRGLYDPSKTYKGSTATIDVVKFIITWYKAKPGAGIFSGIPPTGHALSADKWETYGGDFESIATDVFFAEETTIVNARVDKLRVGSKYLTGDEILAEAGAEAIAFIDLIADTHLFTYPSGSTPSNPTIMITANESGFSSLPAERKWEAYNGASWVTLAGNETTISIAHNANIFDYREETQIRYTAKGQQDYITLLKIRNDEALKILFYKKTIIVEADRDGFLKPGQLDRAKVEVAAFHGLTPLTWNSSYNNSDDYVGWGNFGFHGAVGSGGSKVARIAGTDLLRLTTFGNLLNKDATITMSANIADVEYPVNEIKFVKNIRLEVPDQPPVIDRRIWGSTQRYYGGEDYIELVGHGGGYFSTKKTAGAIPVGTAPTNTFYWNPFSLITDSLYADIISAVSANITNIMMGQLQSNNQLISLNLNQDNQLKIRHPSQPQQAGIVIGIDGQQQPVIEAYLPDGTKVWDLGIGGTINRYSSPEIYSPINMFYIGFTLDTSTIVQAIGANAICMILKTPGEWSGPEELERIEAILKPTGEHYIYIPGSGSSKPRRYVLSPGGPDQNNAIQNGWYLTNATILEDVPYNGVKQKVKIDFQQFINGIPETGGFQSRTVMVSTQRPWGDFLEIVEVGGGINMYTGSGYCGMHDKRVLELLNASV